MILLDCKKNTAVNLFNNILLSHRFRVSLLEGNKQTPKDFDWFLDQTKHKRICIFIHGYNSDTQKAVASYQILEKNIGSKYDVIVGLLWPGAKFSVDFWWAQWNASRTGKSFAKVLKALKANDTIADIQTHSLGARVGLSSLYNNYEHNICNLILSAAAVNQDLYDKDYAKFEKSCCVDVFNCFSMNDPVLKTAFKIADLSNAIGCVGLNIINGWEKNIDLSKFIFGHSDYRICPEYYAAWEDILKGEEG